MKINFVISKTYNLFHFVQNMSEWSKYCRAKENRDWILKMGPLNEQEKEALADVADVLKIYGYDKPVDDYRNIFEFFATLDEHRDYSSRLEKLIGKESADSLLGAMDLFGSRFEKIWNGQKTNFEAKKQAIEINLHENEIREDFKKLFEGSDLPEIVDVYLIINTSKGSSGGANIGKGRITLECSSTVDSSYVMGTLWHEIAHLILADYVREAFELTGREIATREFVNEVLAHSLFGTFGVLTHKYFPIQNLIDTKKMVDDFVETGKVSESGKLFIDGLPFGLGPYYMAKYIEEKLMSGDIITPEEAAEATIEVHKKA